jgi:hypothetical protein
MQFKFEIRRFGKKLDAYIVEEGATETEAREKAKRHLAMGETLGKMFEVGEPR